jgi:hypothetical protein
MARLNHATQPDDYSSAAANVIPFVKAIDQISDQKTDLLPQYWFQRVTSDYSLLKIKSGGNEMTTPTREEIDAKLAAAEARNETRFVELSGKMERIIEAVNRSNSDYLRTAGETKDDLRAVNQRIAAESKDTRHVIIGTIIASVLAALAAIWVTQANLIAAFQDGITLHDTHSTPPKP